MGMTFDNFLGLTLALVCCASPSSGVAAETLASASHFEARHTHPVELVPGRQFLLALNSMEARVSLLDVSAPDRATPVLVSEIPVGIEPVSVRAWNDDEAWIVNEVSDSVSVVSLRRGAVVATLPCPDEPSDVVFVQGRAYVSCARNRLLRVFDVATRHEVAVLPLEGLSPRALAVDPAGTRVFVAFLHSGNQTTVLPASAAPAPETPSNPNLPPAPQTALIVDATDPRIRYRVLDHDVAVVPVANPDSISYLGGVGTSILSLAVRPGSEDLWVGNTDADNLTRYEPRLKGRFARNRLTWVALDSHATSVVDLSPFDGDGKATGPAGRDSALAQPMAVEFSADGEFLWVAAFGSDRVACIATEDGTVREQVDLRPPGEGSRRMRGPRGLAWDEERGRLYVFNKLANSLSVVDSRRGMVLSEVPLSGVGTRSDEAREGRGFLFDARLSGNGATSCATCHLDADLDGLAWDLGDPAGSMVAVEGANLAVHDPTVVARPMHPMKGPMLTQTLRGIEPGRRLHWRGDRSTLHQFNPTFRDLLGGELVADEDIRSLEAYLRTLRHHPNPHRNPDNSLPTSFQGGDAARGGTLFAAHLHHCAVCHVLPKGTDNNIDDPRNLRLSQPVQNPSLHTTYQRAILDARSGATNLSGFGLLHDGTGGLAALPTVHFYDLDALSGTAFKDVAAYVLCFDSGTAPVVGRALTLTVTNRDEPTTGRELDLLESQSARPETSDLVVHGLMAGQRVSFFFDAPTSRYLPHRESAGAWTRAELLAQLRPDDVLTALATQTGQGRSHSLDRDGNGVPDGNDPMPRLVVRHLATGVQVEWPIAFPGWFVEATTSLVGDWRPEPGRDVTAETEFHQAIFQPSSASRFFRLRRTW